MGDLESVSLKVAITSFSLMGQIARGGGELVRVKHAMGRDIKTAFSQFPSGTPKAYEISVPYYLNVFLLSALIIYITYER